MSTRSDIIVHRADGKWHRIYCHSDGYLEYNGKILFEHYTSQKHAEALVALGDLSVLGPKIGVKHAFDKPRYDTPERAVYDKKFAGMCMAYGRDRGEKDVAGIVADTHFAVWPGEGTWTEFTYVWADANIEEKPRDPCWWVGDPDKGTQDLVNLGDALQGKITIRPAVKAFGMVIGQHEAINPKNPDHGWKSIR